MISVVLLQNVMDVVLGPTASYSATCLTCDDDDDGKEEVSMKVEDAIDIKGEIPEAISLSPIKTEQEVWLWGVCEVVAAYASMPFVVTKRRTEKLHLTICCFVLYYLCRILFEI